jgi:SAM-dependent methyltransferase
VNTAAQDPKSKLKSVQASSVAGIRILVKTEREVAYESPDHLTPWGTKQNNSTNGRFNDKLYKLYPRQEQLKVLDMGCSGGGFVKSCLDDGCFALGLEGSDFSKRHRRAEWRSIPEHLFTCDVTGDFEILIEAGSELKRLEFDVVTCWEMIEHIAEPDIAEVAENVKRYLAPGGIWIMSVSPNEEVIHGVRLHQTVQPKSWWVGKFTELGLEHSERHVRYFNTQFVRGPKYNGPGSFHLVLTTDKKRLPAIPRETLLRRLNDLWIGSLPQKVLAGTY